MGNQTNTELWAAQERLRAIERAAYWRGWVKRKDLVGLYGVSLAQASSDLQKYHELNPGALTYNMNAKRYESGERMVCVLGEPRLEEAMAFFLDGGQAAMAAALHRGGASSDTDYESIKTVAMAVIPKRRVAAVVERALFLAVCEGARQVAIRYWSMHSGTAKWRLIAPRAFGHDGDRWHVRAWCFENEAYRDFVLGRVERAKWPEALVAPLPEDIAWEKWITLEVRPHSSLSPNQRRALEMDYQMRGGQLKLKVREAMADYLRARLRLPTGGLDSEQSYFELVD